MNDSVAREIVFGTTVVIYVGHPPLPRFLSRFRFSLRPLRLKGYSDVLRT